MDPLPRGVKFSVTDIELLEDFLRPHVNNQPFERNVVRVRNIYDTEPRRLAHPVNMYFPPMQYWYYVPRVHLARNRPNRSLLNSPNAGKWRFTSTKRIVRGAEILGYRETLVFCTPLGARTGWRQNEYRLAGNCFQPWVLVHLFYEAVPEVEGAGPGVEGAAVGANHGLGGEGAAVGANHGLGGEGANHGLGGEGAAVGANHGLGGEGANHGLGGEGAAVGANHGLGGEGAAVGANHGLGGEGAAVGANHGLGGEGAAVGANHGPGPGVEGAAELAEARVEGAAVGANNGPGPGVEGAAEPAEARVEGAAWRRFYSIFVCGCS